MEGVAGAVVLGRFNTVQQVLSQATPYAQSHLGVANLQSRAPDYRTRGSNISDVPSSVTETSTISYGTVGHLSAPSSNSHLPHNILPGLQQGPDHAMGLTAPYHNGTEQGFWFETSSGIIVAFQQPGVAHPDLIDLQFTFCQLCKGRGCLAA